MRWFWQKQAPVEIPEDARYVITREGRTLVVPPKTDVIMMPVQVTSGRLSIPRTSQPKWLTDPLDIEPAFHVQYEEVKIGPLINLRALKNNMYTAKLQAKEVVTDPKRVARRHWHRHLTKRRTERIIQDSRLFI